MDRAKVLTGIARRCFFSSMQKDGWEAQNLRALGRDFASRALSLESRADALREASCFLDQACDYRPRRLATGEILYVEGDRSRDVFVLVSGRVGLFRDSSPGDAVRPALVYQPESLFGEIGPLLGQPRPFTAKALQSSDVRLVPAAEFRTQLEALDPFVRAWLVALVARFADQREANDLARPSVLRRARPLP